MKMTYTSKTAVYTYKLITGTQTIEGEYVIVNGVLICMREKRKKPCRDICVIKNISSNRLYVKKIIRLMRRFEVSPINAAEVVQDLLASGVNSV